MEQDSDRALTLATEAGTLMLENGAEISRVEETMERIATHYGVDDENFFVLSNGIITTGNHYARAKFIPIKGTKLSTVVEVNQLSRDVSAGECSLDELEQRLHAIRHAKSKPWWEVSIGIAFGVACFCLLFGGELTDAVAAFPCGLLLGIYIALAGPHLGRLFSNIVGGLVGGGLCIAAYYISDCTLHLPNMIIGTIIAMVPGVPFTNGMRDIANEDIIAGSTRLLDASLIFLCIAFGVMLSIFADSIFNGGELIAMGHPIHDDFCAQWFIQLPAAFLGTMGFSILFGSPRRYYLPSAIAGTAGWAVWISLTSAPASAAFLSALVVATVSELFAKAVRCPSTVFLICGIIPLVPGGGIFWTAYFLVSDQLRSAAYTGYTALKITIAIAGGIILAGAITARILKRKRS